MQFDNTTALLTTAKSLKNAKLIVVMDIQETKKRWSGATTRMACMHPGPAVEYTIQVLCLLYAVALVIVSTLMH